jgi:hypothetical protein
MRIRRVSQIAICTLLWGCSSPAGVDDGPPDPTDQDPNGNLSAFFIGNSAMNDIVADHVATTAALIDPATQLALTEATSSGISLRENMEVPSVSAVFDASTHSYDVVVLTEMWDFQNYDPAVHGRDTNAAPAGCPGDGYDPPSIWTAPPTVWMPNPVHLQRYRNAFICGKADTRVFYYQSWSLGYNEVTDGATRASAPGFVRPTRSDVTADIAAGDIAPDLPLADRIEYEGVKWESFVAAANRPDITFIPAAYALSKFMRAIENGTAPGFGALATTGGIDASGKLAWADYLFYEDQYHLASIGQYLMGLVIYAGVFNLSPLGAPIGGGLYPNSEFFQSGQFPLQEVSDAEYRSLLTAAGANGVYDLRGYAGKDYVPTGLRIYLQELAWETIVSNR